MSYKDKLIKAFPVFSHLLKNPLIKSATIAGGAAGALTVTGIKKDDEIVSVVNVSGNTQVLAAGGAAGDLTATGVSAGDVLKSVINLTDLTDVTSEFSITADDTINNTGGTATTGDVLLVVFEKAKSDLASEFIVTADNTVNNTGGTATTGMTLLVTWLQWAIR